jgi:uncharacterized membrane protein YphA (DoxX/SURF4 family)
MKVTVNIVRVIVGVLFIFSGLVKANDPHGLSYKMQEFFELWDMSQFHSWTLALSILMNAFEIIAGFALLLGWRIRLFIWLLFLLIVFFTFLTGYTYITGKPANCGCFGDCIPITSKTSFLKDVILTLLIGFLMWKRRLITPLFSSRTSNLSMLGVTIFSFGLQWYSLAYLPIVDCLPFKKENNVLEKMRIPPNAIPDSTVITFVYKKEGKEVEFTADKFPDDFNTPPYEFVKRYDKVIRQGKNNIPPIKGFSLSGVTNEDSTLIVLSQPFAILLFCEDFSTPLKAWQDDFTKVYAEARQKNIPVYAVTTQLTQAQNKFSGTPFSDIQIFKCDYTAIRTAARANPTVYLLKNAVVEGKWSYRNMGKVHREIGRLVVPVKELPPPSDDSIPQPIDTSKIK